MAAAVLDRQQSLATWSHHSLMNHPPLSHPFQPSPVVMPNLPQATQSFAPAMPFPQPQPAIPEHNAREMTRDMLITVLNDFSQTLAQHFDRFSLRLVVHGGACMLLHPGLHRLSQQLHKLNPSKPRRKTTRDVDYIHRAFVTEMASFGIDDAAEKLKACILATAQKFGLGKDWMNSDADVALPMAFDPSGKTFDPIYTASIQHYNLELHTIYRSPNGMLTLISVTPFWAVSLKLTRYSKWDPDDICLLLRNGTVLSGTNWTADTLRSWLYSNCWAMGYHKFDPVRKNQVEQRINHAIEMLNTIWSSVPVQPPSAMIQGKAVSAHDAMGGGSVVGGDDEESREGWWSNSQWPKGKKAKKSSGRGVGPSASFSSVAEASSSSAQTTAAMQMPVPIPTGGASASMPFIGPGASSHRAAILAADAARLNSPLNVRNWSTPDPVSSERKEKRRSASRSRSRHRSGSSGSKSRSGSPTRGRTRQQSIFVPPDADTDWPAPSYNNNRDGPSTSSGSESRRPRSRSTRRRARDVSPAQQHAEYDDPWEKYYNTAGQSHHHHTTPKPSNHSRTMSWNPQQQQSQHGLDGMNRTMMASLQYGRNANIQTTPPQPPGSQATQLHSHHHHHHSYSQSSSYRHDSQPTQPVPPTVVVTSDRRRRERQRKRDRERDRQSKRMHLTRMYDDTESDSDVGSSGEDSENDENIYAVDRNGNARSAGATATATAVGGGSSTSTFPQPVQVPGGGLVLPLHFQNGTVIFPFGSSGSGGGGNGDGNGGGSGSGSGGGQRERPVRKLTWEIYGPPSSKTTPQTQLQIPLPATAGAGAAQGVGLYSPYRSGSANPTPNSSQPGSRAQSPKHRPPQLNIPGGSGSGPPFPVPVIPGVPIQGAAAHPVIPVSTSHSGPTTNGSMARSHSGGGSSGANLAMSMSMAMEDVPTPTPSSGYNPSQLAQMQFEKQQKQYRQQLMQQQQLYFKQQGQFQQGVSASGGGTAIYGAPANGNGNGSGSGSGNGSSAQQQQQRMTYSYRVNASYSSG